jgi:hypothetical protein
VVHADLVGADGAWSRIRPLLTPAKPSYTGITVVEMRLTDAVAKHSEALALTGRGSFFVLSDNKYIGGHGGNTIALGCGLRVGENWVADSGIDWHDPESARAGLLREYPDWATTLTDLIRECDDGAIWPRKIYALPTGLTWERVPGVTLVGDAAPHVAVRGRRRQHRADRRRRSGAGDPHQFRRRNRAHPLREHDVPTRRHIVGWVAERPRHDVRRRPTDKDDPVLQGHVRRFDPHQTVRATFAGGNKEK